MLYLRHYFKISVRGFERKFLDSVFQVVATNEVNQVELSLCRQLPLVFFSEHDLSDLGGMF